MGCEPDLLCGRPCDLPGCAASTNPSLSFCPPGLPPIDIERRLHAFHACERVDPVLIVTTQAITTFDLPDVIGSAFDRPPTDFGIPVLGRRIQATARERYP